MGSKGKLRLTRAQLQEVLETGAKWAVENGYGREEDLKHIEEQGCMKTADASKVSDKAIKRGMPQLGSLGAGNHFLEIQKVDKIFLPEVAKVFGIENENKVMIMVHTGSRGFGHQVCSDYIRILETRFRDEIRKLPDRELVYAPAGTKECEDYFAAMSCAANFGFCNREIISHWLRESFTKVLGTKEEEIGLELVYSISHNLGKIETHKINGEKKKVYVHRKGGTAVFPAGHPKVPEDHRSVGMCSIVPGSMGTASYVLVGLETAEETFYSTVHGAGRMLSRSKARRTYRGEEVKRRLASKGILTKSASWKVLSEEVPEAYKNVHNVVKVCEDVGISKIVARLVPLAVAKG